MTDLSKDEKEKLYKKLTQRPWDFPARMNEFKYILRLIKEDWEAME